MINTTLQGVTPIFKNFEGRKGKYNEEGKKSFAITLSQEDAAMLSNQGYNVKYPKDVENPPYLSIAVAKNYYNNPSLFTVDADSNIPTEVAYEDCHKFDSIEFEYADVTIRPYEWTVNGNSGVKAYLDEFYGKLVKKPLASKYSSDNIVVNEDDLPFD